MYLNYDDLEDAYYRARRGKLKRPEIIAREENLDQNMKQLYHDLCIERYTISTTKRYIIQDPVMREIIVLSFRDRIVQHLIHGYLYPLRDRRFIHDSYSNRVGKGTLAGIQRADRFMRSCSRNYTRDCYVMKCDIQSFFLSIQRQTLRELIVNKLWMIDVLWDKKGILELIKIIIFHDYCHDCVDHTNSADRNVFPSHKSLCNVPLSQGMPLGNLTSQLFANIYLHELDFFVKHDLKLQYYVRYVDDFVVCHPDKIYLQQCAFSIKSFLLTRLSLLLHPDKFYLQHYKRGVKFLGTMIYPYYRMISKRIVSNCFRMLQSHKSGTGKYNSLMSYCGFTVHHSGYLLRKERIITLIDREQKFWILDG